MVHLSIRKREKLSLSLEVKNLDIEGFGPPLFLVQLIVRVHTFMI